MHTETVRYRISSSSISLPFQPAPLPQQINRTMFQVPPHFQPQVQQEPAAFMIVPIPQQSQVQVRLVALQMPSFQPQLLYFTAARYLQRSQPTVGPSSSTAARAAATDCVYAATARLCAGEPGKF